MPSDWIWDHRNRCTSRIAQLLELRSPADVGLTDIQDLYCVHVAVPTRPLVSCGQYRELTPSSFRTIMRRRKVTGSCTKSSYLTPKTTVLRLRSSQVMGTTTPAIYSRRSTMGMCIAGA